jgi:hypothetical protein
VLPHWSDHTWDDMEGFPGGESIGANYYPELGCYSSTDKSVIDAHMKMIREAGIGVVVITWWGKDSFEDKSVLQVLKSPFMSSHFIIRLRSSKSRSTIYRPITAIILHFFV